MIFVGRLLCHVEVSNVEIFFGERVLYWNEVLLVGALSFVGALRFSRGLKLMLLRRNVCPERFVINELNIFFMVHLNFMV